MTVTGTTSGINYTATHDPFLFTTTSATPTYTYINTIHTVQTTEKQMETKTDTEEEEEEEVFSCYNCGTEYSDEDDSNECCFDCGECGESWHYEEDALQCCNYCCPECGETFNCEDSASECCAGDDSGSMGTSSKAPWAHRGIDFSSVENSDDMQAALTHWGIGVRPDATKGAADFYLLDIMSNDLYQATGERTKFITPEVVFNMKNMLGMGIGEMRQNAKNRNLSPFEALMLETSIVTVEHTELFDRVLLAYCQMAIGGELRHHQAVGGVVIDPPSRRSASWFAWKDAVDMVGPEIFLDAALLFREFGGTSYGGKKWAVPSEIVHMRLTDALGPTDFMNRKLFIDRVWTLEHNGGCFLNKVEWPNGLDMQSVLNAHASNPENVIFLWTKATKEVKELFINYITMVKENNPDANIPDFDPDFVTREITYCGDCYANTDLGHHFGCKVITEEYSAHVYSMSGAKIQELGNKIANKVMDSSPFYDANKEPVSKIASVNSTMNVSFYTDYDSAYIVGKTLSSIKYMKIAYDKNPLNEHQSEYKQEIIENASRVEVEMYANYGGKNSSIVYETIQLQPGQASALKTFGDVLALMKKKVA